MPIFVWIAIAIAILILAAPPIIIGAAAWSFLNGPAGFAIALLLVGCIIAGALKRK